MINITLPDGSRREFENPVSVMEVAQSIGAGLAKATIAGAVDGVLVDASDVIDHDASLRIITAKDEEGVEIIRHSCAHLVGHAVKQLYPDVKMVIGPVIAEGFYYDIYSERPFTPDDMAAIEKRMGELIAQDYDVIKKMTPRAEVIEIFKARGEDYKLRLIEDMSEDIQAMGMYYHQEYVDMCRGPHVPNTRFLKAFKLTRISGAYWRGDAQNEQLQRIYGTAWPTRSSSRRTSSASKKLKCATTAASASSRTCSTCRKKHRAWCSGTRRAGRCGRWSSSTCARSTATAAMAKCAARRSWT